MRYFCFMNILALVPLSVLIYYAFVWAASYVPISNTYATVVELHKSPLFYLTVFLIVGFCYVVDLFMVSFKFNFLTNPTDFLRTINSQGKKIDQHQREFQQIHQAIQSHYINEDIKREAELEQRRERIAALLLQTQQREQRAKVRDEEANPRSNLNHKVKPEAIRN